MIHTPYAQVKFDGLAGKRACETIIYKKTG